MQGISGLKGSTRAINSGPMCALLWGMYREEDHSAGHETNCGSAGTGPDRQPGGSSLHWLSTTLPTFHRQDLQTENLQRRFGTVACAVPLGQVGQRVLGGPREWPEPPSALPVSKFRLGKSGDPGPSPSLLSGSLPYPSLESRESRASLAHGGCVRTAEASRSLVPSWLNQSQ